MQPKKILILSASAGAGHVRAGQALEKAFKIVSPDCVVKHHDTLEFTNKTFRKLYSQTYIDLVNRAPEVLGLLYDYLDKPFQNERMRFTFDRLNTKPFRRMIEEVQPDIAVCTHFLPSEIISWLKEEERLSCKHAVVVTDLDVHAMWLCHNYEHYFVALEETKIHLQKLGVPNGKVSVTGIPIDPVFWEKKDKAEMRRKHGLHADRTTLLVSAGGFGVGPVEGLLHGLVEIDRPLQVVFICGKSAELKERMEKLIAEHAKRSKVAFKVLGFTTEMDELMSASDILLGKPGGLTTSEALAKGLVFTIVNPIPGQEERNSDHLLEEGVGIRCNNLPALSYKIEGLLGDPARLESMQKNSMRMAKPFAAKQIAETLLR